MSFRLLLMTCLSGIALAQDPPPAPTGVVATSTVNARIDVDWNDVQDVSGYNIYRSPVSGGPYAKLNLDPLPTSAVYPDSAVFSGSRYFYVIRSVINGTNESANSSEVNAVAFGTDNTPPLAPLITSQSRKTRDATPSTSGTGEPDTTIRLYRNGVQIGSTVVPFNGIWTISNPTSLGADGTYTITARASDSQGQSPASGPIQITLDTTAPVPPTNITSTAYSNCIDVEWTASVSSDVAGYKIQRKTGSGGSWATLNSNLVTGTKYRDITATNGNTYYYRVIAVDDALDY